MKQQGTKKNCGQLTAVSRRSGSKAPGTRLGMLEDWREASSKSGRSLNRRNTLRDGRSPGFFSRPREGSSFELPSFVPHGF
jgi:hypothetical protein